jgi:NAD(P)-dependent dehydrogenase (short-subunit alcohol dehydrogenase family)
MCACAGVNGRTVRCAIGLAVRLRADLAGRGKRAALAGTVPLERMGTPDDLGKAAMFLASDDSAYVDGIELAVDGGAAQY